MAAGHAGEQVRLDRVHHGAGGGGEPVDASQVSGGPTRHSGGRAQRRFHLLIGRLHFVVERLDADQRAGINRAGATLSSKAAAASQSCVSSPSRRHSKHAGLHIGLHVSEGRDRFKDRQVRQRPKILGIVLSSHGETVKDQGLHRRKVVRLEAGRSDRDDLRGQLVAHAVISRAMTIAMDRSNARVDRPSRCLDHGLAWPEGTKYDGIPTAAYANGRWMLPCSSGLGSSDEPIRNSSTAWAAWRPSAMAQTIRLWPRVMSPAVNTLGTLVRLDGRRT